MSSDVDQRAPRRAVALQPHLAPGERGAGEVVDDDVGAQPRARAVGRGVAQVGRAEVVVGELAIRCSAITLLTPYGVTGLNSLVLGDRLVAGGAVEAARGREDVAR